MIQGMLIEWGLYSLIVIWLLWRYRKGLRLNKLRKLVWARLTRNWGHRSGDRPSLPPGERFSVFQRDGFKCVYCGHGCQDGRKLHLDHYVPWWKVRSHDPANFVTACDTCNGGKGGRIMKRPIEDFVR